MALVMLIVGAALTTFGAALCDERAAVIVAGLFILLGGIDLSRTDRTGS